MAEYQLTEGTTVIRTADHRWIPDDPGNLDRQDYNAWLEAGGVPDPYVEPEPAPAVPTAEQEILFDHENRVRALEGQPPLTLDEFTAKATPK